MLSHIFENNATIVRLRHFIWSLIFRVAENINLKTTPFFFILNIFFLFGGVNILYKIQQHIVHILNGSLDHKFILIFPWTILLVGCYSRNTFSHFVKNDSPVPILAISLFMRTCWWTNDDKVWHQHFLMDYTYIQPNDAA